mgnify:CR=1 FL=1
MVSQREKRRSYAVGFCACESPIERGPCTNNHGAIMEACGVRDRENADFRDGRERRNQRLSGRRRPNGRGRFRQVEVRNMTWKDKHCAAALFSPDISQADAQAQISGLVDDIQNIQQELLDILTDAGVNVATEALQRYATRAVARQVIGGVVAPLALAVNVISGLWTAWSTYSDISAITDLAQQQLETLQNIQGEAQRMLDAANAGGAEFDQWKQQISEEMRDAVGNEPCLRARRCFLVPYKNVGSQIGDYTTNSAGRNLTTRGQGGIFGTDGVLSLADSRGCCPGQTGHHVLPQSWLAGPGGTGSCPGYNHRTAPVACLEGYNQHSGSHGSAHDGLDGQADLYGSNPMTMDEGIDAAAEAYTGPGAPGDHCDKACIKEQLKAYYKDLGCSVVPVDRNGNPVDAPGRSDGPTAGV